MILKGKSAVPGIAAGRIFIYKKNNFLPPESFIPSEKKQEHLEKYLSIKKQAFERLEEKKEAFLKHDPEKAEILIAHQEIVEDIIINEEIQARVLNDLWSGDWAIFQVYENVLVVLRNAEDKLISERAADFHDVRSVLLSLWYGEKDEGLACLKEPCIVAAYDIAPSEIAGIDKNKALAILTETGGITGHAAIIAKSFQIPAVFGIHGLLAAVKDGQPAAVNADEGYVILDPDETLANEYKKKSEALNISRKETEAYLYREAKTADGVRIDIGLNIANADSDLEAAESADSVGVFRTEFLFMREANGVQDSEEALPSEDEQFFAYRKTLECFGEKPVILRTLDIGGDKMIAGIDIPREENPFLGNRALRFCFSYPEIFKTQIRAALRASVYGNLLLMLPMVGSLDDLRKAKEYIVLAKEELKNEGKNFADIKIGIMIEIPSIALIADMAANEVDFASIGSNDLIQYLCAADRVNSAVEDYYQSYHPALFRLIKETVASFKKAGKPVSICGELGSDLLAVPLLIGLGLRNLSMNAASVASVKRTITRFSLKECEEIAEKVLELPTAEEVKKYLNSYF